MTEQCSGATGDMADVSWYVVPGADAIPDGELSVAGYWSPGSNRIVLAGNIQRRGGTVRHEMLHALLRQTGHPRRQFLGACGGVVGCESQCVIDAGTAPAPDPTWPLVPPESTDVSVAVGPPIPSSARYDGTFMVIVTARNRSSHGVVVQLDRGSGPRSFSYRFAQGAIATDFLDAIPADPTVGYFGPLETKRMVFDFTVGGNASGLGTYPGAYQLSGGFGLYFTPQTTLTVAP